MDVIRFEECPPYQPAGHAGVTNRLLVGRDSGGVGQMSIWHGTVEAGGLADPHAHDDALHVYYVVTGVISVASETSTAELSPGDVAVFQPGESHSLVNETSEPATLLVVSTPALR
jgi:quercetin dioxygenase-like cupin family protein